MATSDNEILIRQLRNQRAMEANPPTPLEPGQEQVPYEEYVRRALAMGVPESAIASKPDYEDIQLRLGGALAKRKSMGMMDNMRSAGSRLTGYLSRQMGMDSPDNIPRDTTANLRNAQR
jgi:hypothetical protein